MGRRAEHTLDQIRQMSIEAAEKIIRKKGIEELSTRKIAAEIGYTSGTLYLVFKNLDDLIVQINGRTLERLRDALHAATLEPGAAAQPLEAVKAIARAYLRFAEENKAFWHLVFEDLRPRNFKAPVWYQTLINQCFAPLLTALKALAPSKDDAEINRATQAVWSMVHGTHGLYLSGRAEAAGVAPAVELVEYQLAVFLRGYLS